MGGNEFWVQNEYDYTQYMEYIAENKVKVVHLGGDDEFIKLKAGEFIINLSKKYAKTIDPIDDIIHGKNKEENIVNISIKNDLVYIFKETKAGVVCETTPYKHWILLKSKPNDTFKRLAGNQPYKFYKEYNTTEEFNNAVKTMYKMNGYTIRNEQENFMVRHGYTYFKNTKVADVSVLSFDIETSGLNPNSSDACVYLITNTFRKNGKLIPKTFNVSDYDNDADMIHSWCQWVSEIDPSILLGHNIVMFDLNYLNVRYKNIYGTNLLIGRQEQELVIEDRPREFRKDGSQSYTYHRPVVFGREVVDTFFLAIKADIGRKYESYGLKAIIKHEGMEEAGRQYYEAGSIKTHWNNPEERKKIIAYAENDSRDPLKLFDLMAATFFYLCPVVPKPFQVMIESAAGSQLNSVLVRSYLQSDHSIPQATEVEPYQGAISFGVPGIYNNILKIDFSALYPSIMMQYEVYDKNKDPNKHFNIIVKYFAEYRQKYKKLYKDTGEKYYDDMQNVAKVVANSCYGFMGSSGLNFNSPECAAFVTAKGRELLTFSIKWATSKTLDHWLAKVEENSK